LSLPYKGKTYLIPPVDAETGLRFQRLAEVAAKLAQAPENGEGTGPELDAVVLDDAGEVDLYRDALGPVYDAMIADRVPWPMLKVAAVTAWLDAAVSREAAEAYWNAAGTPDPEALAGIGRAVGRPDRPGHGHPRVVRPAPAHRRRVYVGGPLRALAADRGRPARVVRDRCRVRDLARPLVAVAAHPYRWVAHG
jgi:hypothetical protein